MKMKKSSKKIVSIVLALTLIITSLPLMLFSAATVPYDPAPKFSEDAIEEGARAWLDDEGNVHATYPAANAEDTYTGEELSIAFYVLELVDMGAKNSSHTNVVLDTIKVEGTSGVFPAADIGTIDLENKRYSVTVTAVDTENWFSQPIYTTVTEVPTFEYDAERYQVFTADTTAAREIMTYDSGSDDGSVIGGVLQYLGSTPQVGVEDETGKDTNALRFIMRSQPTSTQTFDTSYSRQTWDYVGADEVWFWMDLADVELTGLSFRLRTNEKMWMEWNGDDETLNTEQRAGSIVYSTKGTAKAGYTGEAPYVWIQREDGGWKKVMLKSDGTLDIGNFKGYIRVPLSFICSETDSYVDISNQELAVGTNRKSGNSVNESAINTWLQSMTFGKITVDPAGTCITDALLIHRRGLLSSSGFLSMGTRHLFLYDSISGITHLTRGYPNNPAPDYSKTGYMLAVPLDESRAKTTVTTGNVSTDRAYIANGAVQNREGGLKAIEDIYNAGFSIEGCSADSIDNSFYLDNVFFYRTDGQQWTDLSLSGYDANTGETMYNYYDQETIIATAIFDAVDKYISTPDWADYREVEYILDTIDGYKRAIEEANSKNTSADTKISTDFLSFENLAIKSQELGRNSWQNAVDAYLACVEAGTIRVTDTGEIICRANANKDELVPLIVNQLEKLPHPDTIFSVSDALREYILEIWRAYSLLNLGQLEMLGKDEEDRILKYIALLDGVVDIDKDEFIVGQSLADRPFILFDDFENYEIGTQSYKLEDAVNIYNKGESDKHTDYRYTKNLVTYAPETFEDFAGKSKDTDNNALSTLLGVAQPTKDGFDNSLKTKASWATITEDGFQGSKGATMYIDSQFYSSGEGVYNILSTTYKGVEAANIDALRAQGTGNSSVKLGNLAKSFSGVEPNPYLSLVFYVDFTQLTDFNMSATIQTYFDGDLNDFQIAMGTNATDQNFFILDPDSGEWVQANNAADAGRSFAYTSRAGADTNGDGVFDITLAGYKGYVRIPLYHFKPGNNGQKLDESAEALNNIYRVSIGIAPGSEAAAVEMDGRSYVIDNIGFSYDPSAYSDGVASRKAAGVTDPYFDEFFDAKSLPAAEFESAVDAIDPYDEATIDVAVANAEALHAALSEYQKGMVEDAYTALLKYKGYSNDHSTIPQPDVSAADAVKWIEENLDSKATGASVTGENDLIYPGFMLDANNQVVPNYGAYGLTAELAATIRDFYSKSYINYTVAEKDQVNKAGFLNAYNAAMRCLNSLESIKKDSLTFLPKITALYTVKYDYNDDGVLENKDENVADSDNYKIGNFISIEGKAEVETFKTNMYDPLQYYSKTSIDDGSIYPQLQNTSRGFTYFLNNTRSFTVDGEEINGGIITFRNKLQNIYDNASTKITNRERLSEDEIREIKDTLEEYNNFLPAYYNVEELYELEQKILRLFPVSEVAVFDAETGGSEVTEVSLNNDNEDSMKKTVYVDMTYIATLLESSEIKSIADVSTSVTLQAVSDLKLTQMEGTTYSSLNSFTAGSLVADTVLDLGEYDNLEPNEVFARIPIEISVDKSVASRAPTGSVYEGSITFNVYETADVEAGLTGEDLVPIATIELPVKFTSTNGTNPTSYKVEIPADQEIDWDDTTTKDVSYTVEANLNTATISIMVEDANADGNNINDLTSTNVGADGNPFKLTYDAENFKETEFTGEVPVGTRPTDIPSITIKQEYWDAVPVGEYKTQLTYTVALEDGS